MKEFYFQPIYDFSNPLKPIIINQGGLYVRYNGKEQRYNCDVIFSFSDKLKIEFLCNITNDDLHRFAVNLFHDFDITKCYVKYNNAEIKAFSTRLNATGTDFRFCLAKSPTIFDCSNNDISYFIFHLYNFEDIFWGNKRTCLEQGSTVSTVMSLVFGKDIICEIANTKYIQPSTEKSENNLTHIGKIHKKDGSFFSKKETNMIISELNIFFSFISGYNQYIGFPTGFNSNGEKVYEEWTWASNKKNPYNNWAENKLTENSVSLFEHIVDFCATAQNKKILTDIIWWYTRSTSML